MLEALRFDSCKLEIVLESVMGFMLNHFSDVLGFALAACIDTSVFLIMSAAVYRGREFACAEVLERGPCF